MDANERKKERFYFWLKCMDSKQRMKVLPRIDKKLGELRLTHSSLSKQARDLIAHGVSHENISKELQLIEEEGMSLRHQRDMLASLIITLEGANVVTAPRFGERLLLLILTKEERVNIPGDLEEEFKQIAAKHGARYAKLWYYKQVATSAWPMMRKAIKWGALAWVGAVIRRFI